jgi:hypothetical protein
MYFFPGSFVFVDGVLPCIVSALWIQIYNSGKQELHENLAEEKDVGICKNILFGFHRLDPARGGQALILGSFCPAVY